MATAQRHPSPGHLLLTLAAVVAGAKPGQWVMAALVVVALLAIHLQMAPMELLILVVAAVVEKVVVQQAAQAL